MKKGTRSRRHNRMMWLSGICSFILILLFNNCSSSHSYDPNESLASVSGDCNLSSFFQRSYHPFLQTNCNSCHVQGGVGKGAFADPDLGVAWNAFSLVGFSKVSEYAVNPSHNPPYSGTQHQETIDNLVLSWANAEVENELCRTGAAVDDGRTFNDAEWYQTRSKPIGITSLTGTSTITFDLAQDLLPGAMAAPNLTGARFRLRFAVREITGAPYYMVSNPVLDLTNSNTDLDLEGLRVKINGRWIDDQTTFTLLRTQTRRGEGRDVIVSSGVLNALGTLRSSDVVSVAFRRLDPVTLPPPPAPTPVNFRVENFTPTEEGGLYDVWVDLAQAIPDRPVIIGLEVDSSTTATPIRSGREVVNQDGDTIEIDNFDWNFKTDTLSMTLIPGQTSARVQLRIADNDRYDRVGTQNKRVVLRLGSVTGAIAGTRNRYTLTIPDDDPAPDPNSLVPTYSQLMGPGGVFATYCIQCHNSVDRAQGYDISNYEEMIQNRVLVPGDISSKMFVRMNSAVPGVATMPLTGLLPVYLRKQVEDWILNGARND